MLGKTSSSECPKEILNSISDFKNSNNFKNELIQDYNQNCIVYYPSSIKDNCVYEGRDISRHSVLKNYEDEDISKRFMLLRTHSIAHWYKSSFAWEDQEIEYELEYLIARFLIHKKDQSRGRCDVELMVVPGELEGALQRWANVNNRGREEMSDIVYIKACYGHPIYKEKISFDLAGLIILDTTLNPMEGCRCIRTENKKIDLYFDVNYFGKANLRCLYTDTDDNVIVRLQQSHLENMPLQSTEEFGIDIPKTLGNSFLLHLYDYQKHSLSWMMKMEQCFSDGFPKNLWVHFFEFVQIPRLSPDFLFSFYSGMINSQYPTIPSFFPKGGILSSESGFGKTIIALALIAARPCPDLKILLSRIPFEKERSISLASKATLIIAPGHLINQWYSEIKKCFLDTKTIVKIVTSKDYLQTSWAQVIQADIVLLSIKFYLGPYLGYISDFREYQEMIDYMRNFHSDPTFQEHSKGVYFKAIYFHRVIVDEFYNDSKLLDIKGDNMWGLTGQQEWTMEDIDFAAQFVQPFNSFFFKTINVPLNASSRLVRYLCFKTHFIKSNVGFIDQPEILEEAIHVQWTNETIIEPIGKSLLGAHEIAQILILSLDDAIRDLTHVVSIDFKKIETLSRFFADVDLFSVPQGASAYLENILALLNQEIEVAYRNHTPIPVSQLSKVGKLEVKKMIQNHYSIEKKAESARLRMKLENEKRHLLSFLRSVSFKRLREKENEKSRLIKQMTDILNEEASVCLVCRDSLAECKLVITDCFHIYDHDCFSTLVSKKLPCPSCRCKISLKRSIEFSKNGLIGSSIDISSLLPQNEQRLVVLSVVKKLRSVLTFQKAKIILFADDPNLASSIDFIITKIGIQSVKPKKTEDQEPSIWQYQKGVAQVLILTPEVDFCGLRLCVSTHIFFIEGPDKSHHDMERLLISRACRSGLKNELVFVRFHR